MAHALISERKTPCAKQEVTDFFDRPSESLKQIFACSQGTGHGLALGVIPHEPFRRCRGAAHSARGFSGWNPVWKADDFAGHCCFGLS
jgi:hypothetical protein